jgi:protein with PEP-CTERM/exosortase system signal
VDKLKYLAAVLIAVAGLGLQQAQADLLAPFQFTLNSPIGSPSADLTYLQSNGGGSYTPTFLPATSEFLFKQNRDDTTDGTFGQYFKITKESNTTWQISWNLTGSGFTLDGVFLKDGVSNPSNQLYRFYGVSANEMLIGSGIVAFNNPVKNISFVEFFGSPGGAVPDGGATVMLLGAALGVLGMARRFLRS